MRGFRRSLVAIGWLASAAPQDDTGELPAGLGPSCSDAAECGAKRPPRQAHEPAKPLVETGGWGFSYGPIPLLHEGRFPNDDQMAHWMRAQWSWNGRDDLGIMARMGANTVRLYGNDPRENATEFLDEANGWGMKVTVGISDWPYIQAQDKCVGEENDCYASLRDQYEMNLKEGGFLVEDLQYHPALDALIVINEPDLKIRHGSKIDPTYMKVVLSAFDGILSAEAAAGVDFQSKDSIKLTATWSYATCFDCPNFEKLKDIGCCVQCAGDECEKYGDIGKPVSEGGMRCADVRRPHHQDDCPGLPMVVDLHAAIEDPASVGYTFKTEGWKEAFANRWVHSLNAFVGTETFDLQFLSKYAKLGPAVNVDTMPPVFLGEFGDPHAAKDTQELTKDVKQMVDLVKNKENPLFAFNFFQFQVAYWKPCSATEEKEWDEWFRLHWGNPETAPPLPSACTERNFGVFALGDIAVSKTGLVGMEGDQAYMVPCLKPIFNRKPEAIALAFGGSAPNTSICESGWQAEPPKYCVAARGNKDNVGSAVSWACGELANKEINCLAGIPKGCAGDIFSKADWIFSLFYETTKVEGEDNDHLCQFDGAGLMTALPPQPECLVVESAGGVATTTTVPDATPEPSPSPAPKPSGGHGRSIYEAIFVIGAVLCVAAGGLGAAMLYNRPRARQVRGGSQAGSMEAGVEMS